MKEERKMNEEKEVKEMTELEQLWKKTFPFRKNFGSFKCTSADGELINISVYYGEWKLEITNLETGKTKTFSGTAIGYCQAKGNSLYCDMRKEDVVDGMVFVEYEPMIIEVVL